MASLGLVDGSNRSQTAKFLRTFRRSDDLSFGDNLNPNEKVEWFTFGTIGNRFNRSSLVFAGSADAVKVKVFFRSQSASDGIGRRLGQLSLTGEAKSFIARPKGAGTYFIQVIRQRSGTISYGISFDISSSGTQRAIDSIGQAPVGRELFF